MAGPDTEGTPPDDERREDDRQTIELKVEYNRLNAFFADYTNNISKGGTFIATEKPLDVGTEFMFKLYVPTLEEPLRIRGRVKWTVSKEEVDDGRAASSGMGIRFIYRDDNERAKLHRFVEELMIGSLGERLSAKLLEFGGRADGGDS